MTLSWGDDFEIREADIPCPGRCAAPYNPREPQRLLGEHRGKLTARYETGEVTFIVGRELPSPSDLNFFAADYRKRPDGMTKWTFIIDNTAEDAIQWLLHHGFARDEGHPALKTSAGIAFTKTYNRRHGNTD